MMEFQEKEAKKLLDENKALGELKVIIKELTEDLREVQDSVKHTVVKMQSWESGNGSDAFKEDLQDYFETFNNKVNSIEVTQGSVSAQRAELTVQLSNTLNAGPKI